MLEIKHLSYQVEGESGEELGILNDVSLTVADHQFVVITGPNGGGKTTLAKAIMGLVRPTGGTIAWNGTDITGLDITQRARLGVSYGFQQPPRFKGLRFRYWQPSSRVSFSLPAARASRSRTRRPLKRGGC